MEVILTQDVEFVGSKNDVVKVKDGFGRNYLIPRGFAQIATASNKKMAEETERQQGRKREKALQEIQATVERFKDKVIKVGAKVGKEGKLFGSVTALQLAEAIKTQIGVDIDRRKILLPTEVKSTGTYSANLDLHKDVQIPVAFEVVED